MLESQFKRLDFICPACRRGLPDGMIQWPLDIETVLQLENGFILEALLVCTNTDCRRQYPVVQGVPVIVANIRDWIASFPQQSFDAGPANSAELRKFFTELRGQTSEQETLSAYLDFHYGDIPDIPEFLAARFEPHRFWQNMALLAEDDVDGRRYAIDLGCSVGRYTFELARRADLAVGVDLNFHAVSSAARIQREQRVCFQRVTCGTQHEPVRQDFDAPQNVLFVVADALDPPFKAAAFDRVTALNLIDNVRIPLVLLGQMDALLSMGGLLIAAAPYQWRVDITPVEEWLLTDQMDSAEFVSSILEGRICPQMQFSYEILEQRHDVPWVLRTHSRHFALYLLHILRARRTERTTD